MDLLAFTHHLERATSAAIQVARLYLTDELPDEVRYLVGSDVYAAAGVLERLWQDDEVPVWIDIMVERLDDRFTYVRLRCSRRTAALSEGLRYRAQGYPPFQCLGPALPPGWKGLDTSGRFDLGRRQRPSPA